MVVLRRAENLLSSEPPCCLTLPDCSLSWSSPKAMQYRRSNTGQRTLQFALPRNREMEAGYDMASCSVQVKVSCTLDLSLGLQQDAVNTQPRARRTASKTTRQKLCGPHHFTHCEWVYAGYMLGICVVADVGQHRVSARRECYIPCHKHVQTAISGAAFLDELTHLVAGSATVLDAAADMHDGAARWEKMGRHGQPPTKQSVHRD